MSENNELILRIRDLEQFKHNLEVKLFAAWAVASVLGVAGVLGGVWLNNVSDELSKLEERTEIVESLLEDWENKVLSAQQSLEKANDKIQGELSEHSKLSLEKSKEAIEDMASEKLEEIHNVGTSDLISILQDGTMSLKLRKLSISNEGGVDIAVIGSDSGGDGVLLINSETGEKRYSTSLINDNAITTYFNSSGKAVLNVGAASDAGVGLVNVINPTTGHRAVQLDGSNKSGNIQVYNSEGKKVFLLKTNDNRPIARFYDTQSRAVVGLGVFSDGDKGFLRIYDPREDKTVAEISSGSEGGRSYYHTQTGKQLIYIGPASNTGDALIKLNSRYGNGERDLSPKN